MIVPSFTAKGGIASVVSGYRGSELEQRYQIHYIETYCDGGKLRKLGKAIAAYVAFLRELILFRPDLVHIHSAFGASFYRKAPFVYLASLLHIPIINHVHGADWTQFYENSSDKKKAFIRYTFMKCRRIIALSAEWKQKLEEAADASQIRIVVNYSDVKAKFPEKERRSETVLFLGFLSQRKGCFDIPQIAAAVRKEIENVSFVLAGSGCDDDVRHLQKLIQAHHVEDCMVFPGWVRGHEKEELLENASIFFLPSYAEGMPMSILEAMGYGLPVVSTNVGSIPQLVTDEENGFLCRPGNIDDMANVIIKLLKDPELRKKMGQNGMSIAKTNYSISNHCDKLIALYEECCTARDY